MLPVFDQPRFISVSEIVEEMIGCNQDLIHIVYSLSKDLGFPGFRMKCLVKNSAEVSEAVKAKGCSKGLTEPGWFRVCFANMDDETMRTALRRIRNFVLQTKGLNNKAAVKKQCSRSKLQISLSFRRLDDFMNSPAHSPMNSPLVRT
ncbi:acetyl-CoA synthetase [Datura stramonium]|uniref:Acetyl-CoA synthetase n=1 Tax=Datura stramonium TaxID=4076 RepID=A0ABS8S8W6_DATST|nr:acetyl-CoA synthetase [Datura stramonium]